MQNDPTAEKHRKEVIFINYEEIVKNPYPLILKNIMDNYRDTYNQFLRLDDLEGYELRHLSRLCLQRTDINIFEYLAKTDFDFDASLQGMKVKYANIYADSELLAIGQSLPLIASQRFNEKMYFYSPVYDPRIQLDIQTIMGGMDKIAYVVGEDLTQVISEIPEKITSFIFSDISQVVSAIDSGKAKESSIILAKYGFNYRLDGDVLKLKIDIEELAKKHQFTFAEFLPMNIHPEDFALG